MQAAPATNVAPVFREDEDNDANNNLWTASRRVEENSARTPVGPPLFATDDDHKSRREGGGPRDVLTYSLEDVTSPAVYVGNAALFSIDQTTGQIMTKGPLNRESLNREGDANDYQYRVLAKATDPSGVSGQITVTIHVLDMAEVPEVRGPAALTYFENQPATIGGQHQRKPTCSV